MMKITRSAITQLKALITEHPEDPIVRVKLKDVDEKTLSFNITIEDSVQPDDQVQETEGLILAVEGRSAPRMQWVTLDYVEPGGFTFHHPEEQDEPKLDLINLN